MNKKLDTLRVTRAVESSGLENPWIKRILELADGKTVDEIVDVLYLEEMRRGGWLADIGFVKGFFQREIEDILNSLEDAGYLRSGVDPEK